jgi:hypothetical protein
MELINIGNIGKIFIPENIEDIINIIHTETQNKEWSGIHVYSLTKGNLSTLKDLEFEVNFVYPMNIGSEAHTTFDFNKNLLEVAALYPEAIEKTMGIIHSH